MNERDWTQKITKWAKEIDGLHWHKLPDMPGSAHKRPYDVFCVYKGFPFAIEFKINTGRVEDHQEEALMNMAAAKGIGLVIWIGPESKIQPRWDVWVFSKFGILEKIWIIPGPRDEETLERFLQETVINYGL